MTAPSAVGGIERLCGPCAVEERLLTVLDEQLAAARAEPSLLARPVLIAVPSASLRAHVAARVVERAGGAVAGLSILTLNAVAQRILQRAGETQPAGAALMPLLVRDLARAEPLLFQRLDSLVDGYAALEATVADLLDAGMEVIHAEALEERLAEPPSSGLASQIARAVVRVAGNVAAALERGQLGSRSHTLRRAAEIVTEDPSRLDARAVFVHGFSDATGRACDLIAALLRSHAARVLIDLPPDPSTGEPFGAFASQLNDRLETGDSAVHRLEVRGPLAVRPAEPRFLAAPGAEAEVRATAVRLAELLRDGVVPETVAVVARDLVSYAAPLRIHLTRLGVPFSGLSAVAAGGGLARKLAALVEILRQRERCPVDRWLDAVEGFAGERLSRAERADLRLGLRHLGAARLAQLPEVGQRSVGGRSAGIALPARRGLAGLEGSEGIAGGAADAPEAGSFGAARRWLSGVLLSSACAAAARTLDWLAANDRGEIETGGNRHAERIRALAARDLGWRPDTPEAEALASALDSLVGDLPPVELAFDDFAHLLVRALTSAGEEALGGAGGGVQILSVMEARARTFEQLFVLGLNREVFPRGIREDPLLGDTFRRTLAELLPDIPIKQRGYDEERHLFAQLVASSARVSLSWQSAGDDGRTRAPSTLVDRLRWDAPELVVETAAALQSPDASRVPIPAHEHALRAALYGGPETLAVALEAACEERREVGLAPREHRGARVASDADDRPGLGVQPRELAAARLAVIREFDAPPSVAGALGPYFGFVGRARVPQDPRFARPYVTALEQLARCPWKSFLERTLRLEPVPDPIEALPEIDALLVGAVVHRVLERMARQVLPEAGEASDLASLAAAGPRPAALAWPGDPEAFGMLREESRQLLAEEGHALVGLVDVLVALAWPRLERARDIEWPTPDSQVSVAGVELEGRVQLHHEAAAAGSIPSLTPVEPPESTEPRERQPDLFASPQRVAEPAETARVADEFIYFRADRVDFSDGSWVLTDYKTGRPFSDAVRPATRRKYFEAAVARGDQLQAVAYALAAPGEDGVGRYLYLTPDVDEDKLEYRAEADDDALRSAFEVAARALLRARREGSFAPRLVESDGLREPALCGFCDVAEACLRGDSGARRRLAEWGAAPDRADAPPAEAALRGVFELASPAPDTAPSSERGDPT